MKSLIKQALMTGYNWQIVPGVAVMFLIRRLGLEAC